MKTVSRGICLMLISLLCLMAIACAQPVDDTSVTTPSDPALPSEPVGEDATTPPASAEETTVTAGFDLSTLDFNQSEVTTLYWSDVERPEFFVEMQTGDNVSDAIFMRNIAVEDALNVKLEYIGESGNVDNSARFLKRIENSFNAGERIYDILASHSRTGGIVAAGGMTQDILGIDDSYIDLDMPWWPASIVDTATISGKMYFISGDISTNTLHFMYGVYYNADMIADLGLEDPTDLALAGDWTLDKMIAMSEGRYADLNSNEKKDYGDAFGLTTLFYHADSFYSGAGMTWISKDGNGDIIISPDYTSERAINLAEKLSAWFATNDCYTENNNKNTYTTFSYGNALFAQNRIYIADSSHASGLNNADFTYGVVPIPKYDENQNRYYTTVGNPFTLYEIMVDCEQTEMVTATLEALAQESYKHTTPAIFEVNMKYKYSANDKTAQAFDIIRSSIVFDLGRIFGGNLNTMSEVYSKACINGQSWATIAATQAKSIGRMLERLVESFE